MKNNSSEISTEVIFHSNRTEATVVSTIENPKTLIIIAGPTAVGKTDLCVRIAKILDTEVVSADSRQFYRELAIGTAKPSMEEMDGVKHHFVDSHSIQDYYTVGDFEHDCLTVLEEILLLNSQ